MNKEIEEAIKRVEAMKLKEIKQNVNETGAETYMRLKAIDYNKLIDTIIKVIKNII